MALSLALDLTKTFPRSPRETLGGYVHAGRMLDKCRATVSGTNGEYHYDCPLDGFFFRFTGIDAGEFKDFITADPDDEAVAAWIQEHSKVKDAEEIVRWNNTMRDKRLSDLPIELQVFLEGYIPTVIPEGKVVRVWFDVYDMEEGRL